MTIRLLYVDRSVHQAWPVARELELGRLCQESVTVAEVTMMGATCFGLVEEVDALRDAVRPGIQGCGDAVRPGMQGCSKSPADAIRRCSAGGVPQKLRRDAPQEVLRRRCTGGDTRPIKLEIKAEDRQEA